MEQLDKWNKEIAHLSDMAENASSAKLFKYYRQSLIDIKKQMKAYIDDYDSLSFAKKLEADRLINIGSQIDSTLKSTYGNVKGEVENHSTISAEHGYYGTWYALEGNENIQLSMPLLDERYIHQLLYKPIVGKTFSSRLYKERDRLASEVKQALLDATRDGKGYAHAAGRINEATEASYKQALRIMRTEGGRAQSEATQKSYKAAEDAGVKLEKRWIATLDKKTRQSHGELDGQTVAVDKKFSYGGKKADGPRLFKIAALDINCRCSTISVVNGIAPDVRRTKNGIEEMQSYDEWADKNGIKVAPKPASTPKTDWDNVFGKTNMREAVGEDNYKAFIDDLGKQTDKHVTGAFKKYGDQVDFYPLKNTGAYARGSKVQLAQVDFDGERGRPALQTVYHELGHAIDSLGKGELKYMASIKTIGDKGKWVMTDFEANARNASLAQKYALKDTIRDDIWHYINGELPTYWSIGKKPRKKAEKEAWLALQDKILTESSTNIDKFLDDYRDKYKGNPGVLYGLSDILEGSKIST